MAPIGTKHSNQTLRRPVEGYHCKQLNLNVLELARRAGLELRGAFKRLDIAQPAHQWGPTGENQRHQLFLSILRTTGR
jgi:hypothetical protein